MTREYFLPYIFWLYAVIISSYDHDFVLSFCITRIDHLIFPIVWLIEICILLIIV